MTMTSASAIQVRGVVQGVGFRPFVYRLAREHGLTGWVSNVDDGVSIHVEGSDRELRSFAQELQAQPPSAATITSIQFHAVDPAGCTEFLIHSSCDQRQPTARISADLPVCDQCLQEMFDPAGRRY